MVVKIENNNLRKSVRQNSGPGLRAMAAPYMEPRCYCCNRPGHIQINCFKRKRDLGGPSGFSHGAPRPNVKGALRLVHGKILVAYSKNHI